MYCTVFHKPFRTPWLLMGAFHISVPCQSILFHVYRFETCAYFFAFFIHFINFREGRNFSGATSSWF